MYPHGRAGEAFIYVQPCRGELLPWLESKSRQKHWTASPSLTWQAVALGDSIGDCQPMTAQVIQKDREILCVYSCAEPPEMVH